MEKEVGKSLYEKIASLKKEENPKGYLGDEFKIEFIEDYNDAQNSAIRNNKNILFIYRSNYSQVSKR